MGHSRAERPGRLSDRYESLTGGRSGRLTYYVIRKRLSFSGPEWDELPWHFQRLYMELLHEELEAEAEQSEDGVTRTQQVDAADEDIGGLGFNVVRGDFGDKHT